MSRAKRIGRWTDRALSTLAPSWAEKRYRSRLRLEALVSYEAAVDKRHRKTIGRKVGSPDDHYTQASVAKMRDLCRHSERNDPFVRGMLDLFVLNTVGEELRPQAQTPDKEWNDEVEKRFAEWALTQCDVTGKLTFHDIVKLNLRSMVRDGDLGNIMVSGGMLQGVEGERIVNPASQLRKPYEERGHKFSNGVEMNAKGRPVAYWVGPYGGAYGGDSMKAKRKRARYFIHLFNTDRYSQSRGVPWLGPALETLQDINEYTLIEIVGAKTGACLSVAVKSGMAAEMQAGRSDTETNDAGESERWEKTNPGQVVYLQPGEDIDVVNPNRPPRQFPEFIKVLARFCMFDLGLPLTMFDMGDASYSAARCDLLRAYKMFREHQRWLRQHFLTRVYRWKVSQFMKYEGLRTPSEGQPWDHNWQMAGWEWVDPFKEVQASIKAVRAGLSSWIDECIKHGKDPEQVLRNKGKTIALAKEIADGLGDDVDWRDLIEVASLERGADDPRGNSEWGAD